LKDEDCYTTEVLYSKSGSKDVCCGCCGCVCVILFIVLAILANAFRSQVQMAHDKWSKEAVESDCFVEDIPNYHTTCNESCKNSLDVSFPEVWDGVIWGGGIALEQPNSAERFPGEWRVSPVAGESPEPNRCQKVSWPSPRIECPCRLKYSMSAVQVRFFEAPWPSRSDSCTTVYWDDESVLGPPADPGDSRYLEQRFLNAGTMRCVYLAGDSGIQDIVRVDMTKAEISEAFKAVEEGILVGFIIMTIMAVIMLCCSLCCCYFSVQKEEQPIGSDVFAQPSSTYDYGFGTVQGQHDEYTIKTYEIQP